MKKRAIPQTPRGTENRGRFDEAVKENLEIITGQRGGKIEALADGASNAEIIAKINELIALLQ